MADRKELRRLAMAATPGEWLVFKQGNSVKSHCIKARGNGPKAELTNICGSISPKTANAAFIAAANPAVVLELLDENEAIIQALPDSFSESKDWKSGNAIERIEWLKLMLQSKREEIEMLEQSIDKLQGDGRK